MDSHDSKGTSVRIEHVITVGLVGDKSVMQELAVKSENGVRAILRVTGRAVSFANVKGKDIINRDNSVTAGRDTTYIKGAFSATDLVHTERGKFLSGQLILPDSASGFVTGLMQDGKALNLDVLLEVHRSTKSIVGFKYVAHLQNYEEVSTPVNEPAPVVNGVDNTPNEVVTDNQASEKSGKTKAKSA